MKISLPNAPLKVLVIEDDKPLAEILEELFADFGYLSTILHYTNDLFSVIKEYVPDIILLDHLLPHINGGELCIQLKKSELFRHIPVIIFSALPKHMILRHDYGYDVFIEKPFDLIDLVNTIEELAGTGNRPQH